MCVFLTWIESVRTHARFYPIIYIIGPLILSIPSNVFSTNVSVATHACGQPYGHFFKPPPPLWALNIILSELCLSIKWRPLDLHYIRHAAMEKLPADCKHIFRQFACSLGTVAKLWLRQSCSGHLVLRTVTQRKACLCVFPPSFPQQSLYFSSAK